MAVVRKTVMVITLLVTFVCGTFCVTHSFFVMIRWKRQMSLSWVGNLKDDPVMPELEDEDYDEDEDDEDEIFFGEKI